jgi:RHS repeat-associated protein
MTGFTGHEHDPELGLVNMKGRLYDARLARFITPDPFVTEPLNPQGLNRYSYVQNNPVNYVDPTGFQSQPDASYLAYLEALAQAESQERVLELQAIRAAEASQQYSAQAAEAAQKAGEAQAQATALTNADAASMRAARAEAEWRQRQAMEQGRAVALAAMQGQGFRGPALSSFDPQVSQQIEHAALYSEYRGSWIVQTAEGDRVLSNAEDYSIGMSVVAATLASGGVASNFAAAAAADSGGFVVWTAVSEGLLGAGAGMGIDLGAQIGTGGLHSGMDITSAVRSGLIGGLTGVLGSPFYLGTMGMGAIGQTTRVTAGGGLGIFGSVFGGSLPAGMMGGLIAGPGAGIGRASIAIGVGAGITILASPR